ncbi:predicted protein [Histoplasma capsulatum var. duboisii H88]|uniref:Predicted protein n=1 Tax=Ajellomyces capsulatus (strain H88) TaxID=544711 RepID=F0UI95_AJEC8|nr:predicted protein [Histoplasma capsulatum var. duboisii H88]
MAVPQDPIALCTQGSVSLLFLEVSAQFPVSTVPSACLAAFYYLDRLSLYLNRDGGSKTQSSRQSLMNTWVLIELTKQIDISKYLQLYGGHNIEQDAYPKQAKVVPEVGIIHVKLRDKLIPSDETASGSNRRTRVQQFPSRFNRRPCAGSAKRPMNSSNVMPVGGMVWRDSVRVQVMFTLDSRGHGAAD